MYVWTWVPLHEQLLVLNLVLISKSGTMFGALNSLLFRNSYEKFDLFLKNGLFENVFLLMKIKIFFPLLGCPKRP